MAPRKSRAQRLADAAARESSPGVISTHEIYTLNELERRTGLGEGALKVAKERGLKVRRFGRKAFVRGEDLDKYLAEQC